MSKLGDELDELLNMYEKIKIPNEVGSYDLTEDSNIETEEYNITPDDSASNIDNKVNIYKIDAHIKIERGQVKELKLEEREEIKSIIESYNKELAYYNKMREDLREKLENRDSKVYQNIISKYEKEKIKIERNKEIEIDELRKIYENK